MSTVTVVPLTYHEIVAALSNWQRNQWARAGYPGLRKQRWQTEDDRAELVASFLKPRRAS